MLANSVSFVLLSVEGEAERRAVEAELAAREPGIRLSRSFRPAESAIGVAFDAASLAHILDGAESRPSGVIGIVVVDTVLDRALRQRLSAARAPVLQLVATEAVSAIEILAAATEVAGAKTVTWNRRVVEPRRVARELIGFRREIMKRASGEAADVVAPEGRHRVQLLGDGTSIAYTEYGSGEHVIITAQMGFPPEPSYPALLAAQPVGARVLAVTLRGFRPSSLATDDLGLGWLTRWADDVAEFATALGIERFSYTGGSHGGGVGWYLAQNHPHRLISYLGVVSGPHDRGETTRTSAARKAVNEAWPDPIALRSVSEKFVFGPLGHPERAARRAVLLDSIVADYEAMLPEEARINQGKPWPDARTDDELAAVLRTIDVPTLLLSGMQDVIISPTASVRASTSVPGAKSVLWQEEGHMTWEEHPQRLCDEVALFLEELLEREGERR